MSSSRHLYIIQSDVTGAFKIGRSDNAERRLRDLQTGSPYRLRLILVLKEKGGLERKIHQQLVSHRLRHADGEWFAYDGLQELPIWVYEMLPLDEVHEWWREGAGRHLPHLVTGGI